MANLIGRMILCLAATISPLRGVMKFAAIVLCCVLSLCSGFEDKTVVEWLADNSAFSTLVTAVQTAGLVADLSSSGPYTVFAPTDAAFNKLGASVINDLLANPGQLKLILQYHVIQEFVLVPAVGSPTRKSTLEGDQITIVPRNGGLLVNSVANVTATYSDIVVNNGIIQPIDNILMPPSLPLFTISQYLLVHDVRFKDLNLALLLADLTTTLNGGDYTMFAPTDQAFGEISSNLINPSYPGAQGAFQELLKHHVIPGARTASQFTNGQQVFSLHGKPLTVVRNATGVFVENIKIVAGDILCTNGVIHAVDHLIVPDDLAPATN